MCLWCGAEMCCGLFGVLHFDVLCGAGMCLYKYVCVWVYYVVQTFITHLRGILCDAVLGFESVFDMVLGYCVASMSVTHCSVSVGLQMGCFVVQCLVTDGVLCSTEGYYIV